MRTSHAIWVLPALLLLACRKDGDVVPLAPTASSAFHAGKPAFDYTTDSDPDSASYFANGGTTGEIDCSNSGALFYDSYTDFKETAICSYSGLSTWSVQPYAETDDYMGNALSTASPSYGSSSIPFNEYASNVSYVATAGTAGVTCGLNGYGNTAYSGSLTVVVPTSFSPPTFRSVNVYNSGPLLTDNKYGYQPACGGSGGGTLSDCDFEDWELVAIYEDGEEDVLWEGQLYVCRAT